MSNAQVSHLISQKSNEDDILFEESVSGLLNPPPILAPEALHGILADICHVATRRSEASKVAIAANVIATFSAMIGRNAHQFIGDGVCHARPYFLLTGRTGKARKGTSEHTPKRIIDAVEDMLRFDNANYDHPYESLKRHDGGLSTGEGLGWSVRDKIEIEGKVIDEGVTDKRLLVVEAEFAGAMAAASREKNNLSATIRTAWDGRNISPLVKNSKWCATDPHIVIVGHITSAELIAKMSDVDAQSGFMNRFIILHIVRPKLVALPTRTPQEDILSLATIIKDSVGFAINGGQELRVSMSPAAVKFWCTEYKELTREQEGIAGSLLVRTEIYCRMLAMIFALMDKTAVIEVVHIKAALAWIHYWKDSVTYIFQTLAIKAEFEKINQLSGQILEFIKVNDGCTKSQITKAFKNKTSGTKELADGLNCLLSAAPPLIRQEVNSRADGKAGKPVTAYFLV